MPITNRLKDLRHEFKMDQKEFYEFLGVNKSLYNRWEKQHGQPNLEWAMKIAKKTNKPINYFIDLIE